MIQVFPTVFPPQNTPVTKQDGTVTNAFMAFFRDLWNRTGQGSGLPNQVDTNASGSLTSDWNITNPILVAPPPVTLPSLTGGQGIVIQNAGPGILTINAPSGATIDGGASYPLAQNKMQIFWFFSSTQVFSTQLG